MSFVIPIIIVIVIAYLVLIGLRCDHYYGVPYIVDDEVHQSCYKCGKIRRALNGARR